MIFFVLFRIHQIVRALKDAGWWHVIILSPFLIVLGLMLLDRLQDAHVFWKIIIVLGMPVWLFFSRRDRNFMKLISGYSPLLFALEYIVLASLAGGTAFLLTRDAEYLWPVLPAGLLAVMPVITWRKKWIRQLPLADYVPVAQFEFRAMLRSQWFFLVVLLLAVIAGRHFFVVLLVSGWFISLLISGSYYYFEPIDLFRQRFNRQFSSVITLLSHGLTLHIMIAPVLALMWYYHPEYIYVLVYFHIAIVLQWSFCLFYKYAHYRTDRMQIPSQVPIALFIGSLLVPLVLPVTLFYWFKYLFNYFRNIQYYAA